MKKDIVNFCEAVTKRELHCSNESCLWRLSLLFFFMQWGQVGQAG